MTFLPATWRRTRRLSTSGLESRRERRLLDVACGAGQIALIAARAGAEVTGCDIATNWIDQARFRAAAEGLNITFEEGDAEALPYEDGQFDAVVSMFGAMFAPRPELVAAELTRVCRPGGLIAMANWTPSWLHWTDVQNHCQTYRSFRNALARALGR